MTKSIRPKPSSPPRRRTSGAIKRPSLPPKLPKGAAKDEEGVCPVCGGKVIEKYESNEDERGRHKMMAVGLHCNKCGLKFEFMPPSLLKK